MCFSALCSELAQLASKQPTQVVTLLQPIPPEDLTIADVEFALYNVCRRGNLEAVCQLLLKKKIRVQRLDIAITLAAQQERLLIVALLMVCRAAMEGRVDFIRFLYGDMDPAIVSALPSWYIREAHMPEYINAIRMLVPVSLAIRHKREKVSLVMDYMTAIDCL